MKIRFVRLIRALYIVLFGHLMLLLSAIAEYDETQLSQRLISSYFDVPEMLESLMMCLLILTVGSFAYYCARREYGDA